MKKNRLKGQFNQLDDIAMPNKDKIMKNCEKVELEKIIDKTPYENQKKPTFTMKKVMILSLAVFLCISLVVSGIVINNNENNAYADAIEFFHSNNIDVSNLTKADVIKMHIEIQGISCVSKEELNELEELRLKYGICFHSNKNGYHLDVYGLYSDNPKKSKSCIMLNDELLITIDGFFATEYVVTEDKILIWGETVSDINKVFLYKLDGTLIQEIIVVDGNLYSWIDEVIIDDGKIVVFSSSSNRNVIVVSIYNEKGILQSQKERIWYDGHVTEVESVYDGYLVEVDYWNMLKFDKNGELEGLYSVETDKGKYFVTDFIEYNGDIYLSANYVENIRVDAMSELEEVVREINRRGEKELYYSSELGVPNEKFLTKVRETYNAVLLVYDKETNTHNSIYEVSGSSEGRLSVKDNELEWRVGDISQAYITEWEETYTVGGVSLDNYYTFNEKGELVSHVKTEFLLQFRE